MAFLIPTAIIAYFVGEKVSDGIISGVSAVHDTFLSFEKMIQDYSISSQKEESLSRREEYQEKVQQIRDKYNLN